MIIYNHNKGRLGNSLFRLFANIVFLLVYKTNGQIYNYIGPSNYCLDDNSFIIWMNDVLNSLPPCNLNLNNSILFDGYYQHDKIFVKYKNEIIRFILNNPDLIIKTHNNDSYKVIDFINYPLQKHYNIVVHLRLEDFIEISQVINPNSIKIVIEELISNYPDEQICFVLNKPTSELEIKYVQFFTSKYSNIVIESNDVITDYTIMKNAKILVCSCSTLSWAASLLSTTLEKVYVPNYSQVNGSHQTFKKPIENTVLYDIQTCNISDLNNILQ
jgi:hypothetical protein